MKSTERQPSPPRSDLRRRIYAVVERIPHGRVATYGQVAALAGAPRHARQVGYALHDLASGAELPWHRVINARGEVSLRSEAGWEAFQRQLLEAEGVEFRSGRVDLRRYRWEPQDGPEDMIRQPGLETEGRPVSPAED